MLIGQAVWWTVREHVIREAHSSRISGHFGVSKKMAQIQRYCYCPRMYETIVKYIKGCVMRSTNETSNQKIGLFMPLIVPLRPWDKISMDFVGGLPMSKRGHDYMYFVVERFSKISILVPCKKKVTIEQTAKMFFEQVWVHFGLPTSIISDRDNRFVG